MTAFRILEVLVLATVLAGLIGLLLQRNLFLKVLAMDVASTGVISLFVLIAARNGLRTPILDPGAPDALQADGALFADPIPQAVILTAIVIGLSVQALLLLATSLLAGLDPSLDVEALEQPATPVPQPGDPA